MLQIHGPSDCLTAEKVHAYMNDTFAVLQFGPVKFYIDDPEQCDWLIKAAAEAKRLLDPPVPGCDCMADAPITDSEPNAPRYVPPGAGERCRAVRPGVGSICTAQPGHDGLEHVVYGTGGRELSRFPVAAERIDPAVVDKAMASQYGWCPAETDLNNDGDVILYCDRENGHPGSHHAPGPDEGSEVAWSDEPTEHAYVTPEMAERRDKAAAEYAAREPGRGLASCGHPADDDGECGCSSWPERAAEVMWAAS